MYFQHHINKITTKKTYFFDGAKIKKSIFRTTFFAQKHAKTIKSKNRLYSLKIDFIKSVLDLNCLFLDLNRLFWHG